MQTRSACTARISKRPLCSNVAFVSRAIIVSNNRRDRTRRTLYIGIVLGQLNARLIIVFGNGRDRAEINVIQGSDKVFALYCDDTRLPIRRYRLIFRSWKDLSRRWISQSLSFACSLNRKRIRTAKLIPESCPVSRELLNLHWNRPRLKAYDRTWERLDLRSELCILICLDYASLDYER